VSFLFWHVRQNAEVYHNFSAVFISNQFSKSIIFFSRFYGDSLRYKFQPTFRRIASGNPVLLTKVIAKKFG